MLRLPARGRHVTREPLMVDPDLLGAPLATFRRRLAAYVMDLVLFGLVVGGFFVAVSLWSIHRSEPDLLGRLGNAVGNVPSSAAADSNLGVDLMRLIAERAPGRLPLDLEDAAQRGDRAYLREKWGSVDATISLTSGPTRVIRDGDNWLLALGTDVWLGEFSSFFSWGAFFVAWFTMWTRATRGRSPGKWLAGIRVVRLDGRPLNWWNAFGRAGGYSASAATLLLGFLEMIWDPNRQTMHDRIAATVVLRGRRTPIPVPEAD